MPSNKQNITAQVLRLVKLIVIFIMFISILSNPFLILVYIVIYSVGKIALFILVALFKLIRDL